MIAPAFQADYQALSQHHAEWGEIACLPWDEQAFGFPVAELRLPASHTQGLEDGDGFCRALEQFCRQSRAELVSLRLPALRSDLLAQFMRAGFLPVDLSLEASSTHLQPARMPYSRFAFRHAQRHDHDEILDIAGRAFEFGRYHTDPRFPRELANRRYVRWMENALASASPDDHVFVMHAEDRCVGFYHAVLTDGIADLRLAAASPSAPVGLSLYCAALLALQQLGARRFVTKVSAANMGVMNIYASIGFRFSKPEYALHWHAPCAKHLRPPGNGFAQDR